MVINFADEINIKFLPKNANILIVKCDTLSIREQKFNNEIVSLLIENKYEVKIGDIIPISYKGKNEQFNDSRYTVNYILEEEGEYYLIEEFTNKVSKYLLPCLGRDRYYWMIEEKENEYFYINNAYLLKENNIIDLEHLYVKCRFISSSEYLNFEKRLQQHELYKNCFEHNNYYTIYKFKIPNSYKQDIQLLLAGKYSELSKQLKNNISSFFKLKKSDHIHQVLSKSSELKKEIEVNLDVELGDSELESKPQGEKEILIL